MHTIAAEIPTYASKDISESSRVDRLPKQQFVHEPGTPALADYSVFLSSFVGFLEMTEDVDGARDTVLLRFIRNQCQVAGGNFHRTCCDCTGRLTNTVWKRRSEWSERSIDVRLQE